MKHSFRETARCEGRMQNSNLLSSCRRTRIELEAIIRSMNWASKMMLQRKTTLHFCRTNTSSSQILNARTNIPQSTTIPHQNLVPIPSRRSSKRTKTIKKSGGDGPDNSLMRRRTNAGRSLRIKAKLMRKYSKNLRQTKHEEQAHHTPRTSHQLVEAKSAVFTEFEAEGELWKTTWSWEMDSWMDGSVATAAAVCLSLNETHRLLLHVWSRHEITQFSNHMWCAVENCTKKVQ